MDQAKLDELKALCEAATPGPWFVDVQEEFEDPEKTLYLVSFKTETNGWMVAASNFWKADAELFAAARTALPALIAEVERLTVLVSEAQRREDDARTYAAEKDIEVERLRALLLDATSPRV